VIPEITESYDSDDAHEHNSADPALSDDGSQSNIPDGATLLQRRRQFLAGISPFTSMSEQELEAFALPMAEEEYEDEPIADSGDDTSIFVLQEGCCFSYIEGQDGDTGYDRLYRVGEIIGIQGVNEAAIEADGLVKCLRLQRETFDQLLEQHTRIHELLTDWRTECAARRIQAVVRGRSVRTSGVLAQHAVRHFSARYDLCDMTVEEIVSVFRGLGLGFYAAAVRNHALDGSALKMAFEWKETTFVDSGPLGIAWSQRAGVEEGKWTAVIKAVKPDSQAAVLGLHSELELRAIDEQSIADSSYQDVLAQIRRPGRPISLSFADLGQKEKCFSYLGMDEQPADCALLTKWIAGMIEITPTAQQKPPVSQAVPVRAQAPKPSSMLRRLSISTHRVDSSAVEQRARSRIPQLVAARAAVAEHIERMTLDDEIAPDAGVQLQELQRELSQREAAFRAELDKLPDDMDSQRRFLEGELENAIAQAEVDAKAARDRERQGASDAAARLMDLCFDESSEEEQPEPEPEPESTGWIFAARFESFGKLGISWVSMTVDGQDGVPVIKDIATGSVAEGEGCLQGMVLAAVSGA
jgi:CRP-like cAMP-binding protein